MRHETAAGQHPFVALLCCADSRVCPEFIFDQAPGSIFEIRNAGNVVDDDVLASFEYAVEHLHVPLIVVMGHKGCGAVTAVYEAGEAPLPEHLVALQQHMSLVREHAHAHDADSNLDSLCSENARQQSELLLAGSKLLSDAVAEGKVRVVYATYDMESGAVEFADP